MLYLSDSIMNNNIHQYSISKQFAYFMGIVILLWWALK